jgi:DNA-binding response OmpR family regulator
MRVLLVDDEAELVSALQERLEMRNIEAEFFLKGE